MVGQKKPPGQFKTESAKLEDVLSSIQELYELYGFDAGGYKLAKNMPHWASLAEAAGGWMKVAKYKIAAFFSVHIGNAPPAAPFDPSLDHAHVLLGGRAYRWLRDVFFRHASTERRLSFLASVLYSKYGMPLPGDEQVQLEAAETTEFLTELHPEMNSISNWKSQTLNNPLYRSNLRVFGSDQVVASPCPGVAAVPNPHSWANSDDDSELERMGYPSMIGYQFVKDQLHRTVDELFPPGTAWNESLGKRFDAGRFPSTKGNYNRGRGQGGAVGSVHELIERKGLNLARRLLEGSWRRRVESEESIENDPFDGREYVVDTTRLDAAFADLRSYQLEVAMQEPPLVEPVGLAEALKVRVISKGPPITYDFLKPLQQYLQGKLSEHPCFSLVGETISVGYIHGRMGARLPPGMFYQSGDYKASTNYLDPEVSEIIANRLADNLSLPEQVRKLFIRALTGHTFVGEGGDIPKVDPSMEKLAYDLLRRNMVEVERISREEEKLPIHMNLSDLAVKRREWLQAAKFLTKDSIRESFAKRYPGVHFSNPENASAEDEHVIASLHHTLMLVDYMNPQAWGQLMGSIVSFPVLCIANAALCRVAIEYGEARKYTLRDARLCINGDDCLFRTNPLGSRAWNSFGAAFGLLPSLGKVYSSEYYLNMNSTSFRRRTVEEGPHQIQVPTKEDPSTYRTAESFFTHVPFVNLRLLHGGKRSMAIGSNDKDPPLGARARDLMATCPADLREVLLKRFCNINWKKLSQVRVPWFAPEWLGGLGLPTLVRVTRYVDEVFVTSPVAEVLKYENGPSWNQRELMFSEGFIDVEPSVDLEGNVELKRKTAKSIINPQYRSRTQVALIAPRYEIVTTESGFRLGPTEFDLRAAHGIKRQWSRKQPRSIPPAATWKLHELVMQQLPVKPVTMLRPVDTSGFDGLYGRLCCSTFMLADSPKDLMDEKQQDKSVAVLRYNERLWRTAPHFAPLPLENLAPRPVFSFLPVSLTHTLTLSGR